MFGISRETPCIMSVQYTGGCSVHWGDTMSTVGGYHDECGLDIMSTVGGGGVQ